MALRHELPKGIRPRAGQMGSATNSIWLPRNKTWKVGAVSLKNRLWLLGYSPVLPWALLVDQLKELCAWHLVSVSSVLTILPTNGE